MRATRTTYRADSQVSKQELGNVNSQSDADWAAFSVAQTVDIGFDSNNRPVTSKLSAGGTDYALAQTSYDALGRAECSAVRMNPAAYGSLPASACTLGTAGSFGSDRITKTIRDAAGQVTQIRQAFGTADEANERTLTYSNNGQLQTLTDAENNKTTYEYDGFDRLLKTRLPDTTKGAGTSSTSDYEQLGYDAKGNVTSRRLRDGSSIAFAFDALNRVTLKDLPGSEPDVTFGYDNLGRLTSASQTGNALSFTYDALSRNLTQVGPQGTVTSEWDLAGRRTKITYPGSGLFVNYDYFVTGEMQKIRENGATSGIGVLATFGYDDLGRRTSLSFGNGASQSYSFDAVSRLASLTANLSGTTNDLTIGSMSYNPASQIVSQNRSNDLFAWTGHGSGSTASVANGLNQLTSIGGSATSHDARGNLTSDPTTGKTYSYSSENLLTGASGGVILAYDPQLRLYQVAGAATTRFAYDGVNMIAEYNGSNALQRRFVFGPGVDEPLVQYEGSGTTDRRFLHADERGSIIAISDGTGAMLTINKYDEFGKPQSTNSGRFQYTGQAWLPEAGVYYYKARMYAPHLGRFLQTDRAGGTNLYAYVGNDPVNATDPSGMVTRTELSPLEELLASEASHDALATHSYDGMATSMPTVHVSGRIDELANLPTFLATASNQQLSYLNFGSYSACVKYCKRVQAGKDEILVQPNPVYQQFDRPSPPMGNFQLAQSRSGNCKAAAYKCLEDSPSGPVYHQQCMELEQLCLKWSDRMRKINDSGPGKLSGIEICSSYTCVMIWEGGMVSAPYPNPLNRRRGPRR